MDHAVLVLREEGQLAFEVMYGDSGFCGSEFYLDTARSIDNDYYFEGAFAISSDYKKGAGTAKTVLAVDLPEFREMPYRTSENGDVTLSQIGTRTEFQRHFHAIERHSGWCWPQRG